MSFSGKEVSRKGLAFEEARRSALRDLVDGKITRLPNDSPVRHALIAWKDSESSADYFTPMPLMPGHILKQLENAGHVPPAQKSNIFMALREIEDAHNAWIRKALARREAIDSKRNGRS